MSDERDLVRNRVDLVDLVSERVKLTRMGKKWKGLCPFHGEKTPSFQVDSDLQLFHCFGCKKGGDLFDWVMLTENVEFRAALEILAERAGVKLTRGKSAESDASKGWAEGMEAACRFYGDSFAQSNEARAYTENRGLDEAVCAKWEIGFAPDNDLALVTHLQRNQHRLEDAQAVGLATGDAKSGYRDFFRRRLMFPIRDDRGRLVAFSGRSIDGSEPKYLNSRESPLFRKSETLFGMFQSRDELRNSREVVLVEGQMDVIACHRAGVAAIAALGTALAEAGARRVKRYADSATLMYDGDTAGRRAAERSFGLLAAEGLQCSIVLLERGEDPDSILQSGGRTALRTKLESAMSLAQFRLEGLMRDHNAAAGISDNAFWHGVKIILASAEAVEADTLLQQVAPLHPNSRVDAKGTVNAFRVDIANMRGPQAKRRAVIAAPDGGYEAAAPRGPERTVLRAALSDALRDSVWGRLGEEELIVSQGGRALADALLSYSAETPEVAMREIVGALPEDLQRLVFALESPPDSFATEPPPVTPEALSDAIARLESEREKRGRMRRYRETPDIKTAMESFPNQ